jgi:uncharacterized protein (TIGR03067 family)
MKFVPTLCLLCLGVVAASLFGQTTEIQKEVETTLELKRLEGTWVPQSINVNGKGEVSDDKIKAESFVFKGKTFQRKKNGNTILEGRLEVDPTQTPKTLNMIVPNRKPAGKSLGVYELTGDTLTVCFDVAGKGRPVEVKAGVDRSLVVYKRQKP